jgi:hypothetical protein
MKLRLGADRADFSTITVNIWGQSVEVQFIIFLANVKIRSRYIMALFFRRRASMKVIDYLSVFNGVTTAQRNTHDNDNAPPAGGTPVALPSSLPPSIVLPTKLVREGA